MKTNVSNTSITNYHNHVVPYVVQPLQEKILGVMNQQLDYTIGELANLTGLDKSCVSARRFSMIAHGLVEKGLMRKCTISGKVCETVRLPR